MRVDWCRNTASKRGAVRTHSYFTIMAAAVRDDPNTNDFSTMKVDDLKIYLQDRGIQLSANGKVKRKAELVDLCCKAREMKQPKLLENVEDTEMAIKAKLKTTDGCLPDPRKLNGWTYNFSSIPEFTFADLYTYLVGNEDYNAENLRSFKSLLGFKLYQDGHVVDLMYCALLNKNFCLFKFSVKPTERSKTEEGNPFYKGFIVMKKNGEIHSAFCQCKGGLDGYCRHVAAALFDINGTVANNVTATCTSGKCEWKRRCHKNEYAVRLKDLKFTKAEFGKDEKHFAKPHDFEPGPLSFDVDTMREKLRAGLQVLYPQAVALQFFGSPEDPVIPEKEVLEHISNDNNVEVNETVDMVYIYTMEDYANIFKCESNLEIGSDCSNEVVDSFVNFLSIDGNQCDVICTKTIQQGNTEFWYSQRTGRITASNFHKICHMKDTTDKTKTIEMLMNYYKMASVPEPLQWGHEKEIAASELYVKKLSRTHKCLHVVESGLVINPKWPYLGASPDRIRKCECHGQVLVECKSMFAKRNLLPKVAAQANLEQKNNGFLLKPSCSWYYQIQGQMAITGIHTCDLVIYTNKVPELLTKNVLHQQGQ
ncbi:hypothetical protein AC249_AIPGENE28621 [Exaiptasia diaphana]|nr:hypothetical protein AC249_AIPGENE28621 [Exaiptasia diaphana]